MIVSGSNSSFSLESLLGGNYKSSIVTGDIILGNVVQMDGKDWLVCHIDIISGVVYLMLNVITETCQYYNQNSTSYISYYKSLFPAKCKTFQDSLSSSTLSKLVDIQLGGVYQKVHIPTYEQVQGEFELFTNPLARIPSSASSTMTFITSTIFNTNVNNNGYACHFVNEAGLLNSEGGVNIMIPTLTTSHGFRPYVALKLD